MKILLSAYACEPDKGSEPGVGWNWALALCRLGHRVQVITRSNNRQSIERASTEQRLPLTVTYFDLGPISRKWKHWPGGIYLYYLLWQWGAYRLARKLHSSEQFDCVHHITFVSYRQPSFMGGLGIPFIFGPVGGGETMPSAFRKGIPLSGRLAELARDLGSGLVRFDPFMARTFSRADRIACTSRETMERIPSRFRSKCVVQLAIGIDEREIRVERATPPARMQFLFIGRLLYWKGLHLALRALAEVRQAVPQATLKIVGQGSDRAWFQALARDIGVADAVEWVAALPHSEIPMEFEGSAGLVFPSLHDSGGMVVLEAMAAGVPVVCLDLGGPGAIVDARCGFAVKSGQANEAAVIRSLADAMILLACDPDRRCRLSKGAIARARELTWDRAAQSLYDSLERPESGRL